MIRNRTLYDAPLGRLAYSRFKYIYTYCRSTYSVNWKHMKWIEMDWSNGHRIYNNSFVHLCLMPDKLLSLNYFADYFIDNADQWMPFIELLIITSCMLKYKGQCLPLYQFRSIPTLLTVDPSNHNHMLIIYKRINNRAQFQKQNRKRFNQ